MAFKDELPPVRIINWKAVARGLLLSVLGVIFLSLFAALLFHFSSLSETLLPWATSFILFLGVGFGAMAAAREAGYKGLWHGLAVGIAFFGLTILVAGLFAAGPFTILGLAGKLLLTLAAGALGGICGVS